MAKLNSKGKGELTEGLFLAKLLTLGYAVLLPFGNNQRYDIVIDFNGKLIKAQCKTSVYYKGCVTFASCSTNAFTGKKSHYRNDVDVFLVYFPRDNKYYMVPVDDVSKTSGRLRIDILKRTEKGCKIRWAKDYELV